MNEAALKLTIHDVQRFMRDGGCPSTEEVTEALRTDHAKNGGRYPTTDEVLDLVVSNGVTSPSTRKNFATLDVLIQGYLVERDVEHLS